MKPSDEHITKHSSNWNYNLCRTNYAIALMSNRDMYLTAGLMYFASYLHFSKKIIPRLCNDKSQAEKSDENAFGLRSQADFLQGSESAECTVLVPKICNPLYIDLIYKNVVCCYWVTNRFHSFCYLWLSRFEIAFLVMTWNLRFL